MSTLSDQLGLGATFRPGPSGWGEQISPFPQGSQGEKFFNSLSNEDKAAINTYVYRAKQKDPSSDGITGKEGILFALSNNPQYAAQALNYGPPRDAAGNVIPDKFVQSMMADTTPGYTGPSSGSSAFAQMLPFLTAYFLPGISSAIAESLIVNNIVTSQVAANVIGNVIANTTASVAQGKSFDDALKNSLVSAAVNTGSVEIAKEVNKYISSKAVTDAIVSAGGSAVKTAVAGGTADDIARNMGAALAGSAASSAYQSAGDDYTRQTGRLIGSTVAGYITGGGTGAVSNLLGELGSQSKGKVAGTIEDIKDSLKGTTDTPALPVSQIASLSPETDAGAATGELAPVTVTGQRTGDITDTDILNTIAAEKKPDAVLQRVEVRGKALPTDITKTDIIDEPAKLQDVTVTGTREEPVATTEEKKTEEPAPKDKPYKPDLFILGGKKPKAPTKPSDSVLSQALGTTTGLTASRGAGEIEDPSTGKKKRKVWNEETLRLKDALGV